MLRRGLTRIVTGGVMLAATVAGTVAAQDAGRTTIANPPTTARQAVGRSIPGTPPFRDTEYGAQPHYGNPDAASRGYAHYDLFNPRYGQWYRPRAFGLGKDQRCQPDAFRPRGYGNLGARPCTPYRMDYHPFVLEDPTTDFGPSYYRRQPDPRCSCHE